MTDGKTRFADDETLAQVARLEAENAALRSQLAAARKVVTLAGELCDAIDAAELDVGGSRPVSEILAELGPAVDAARAAGKP